MTSTEPTDVEELSGRVLEIIGTYRMSGALDSRDLYLKTAPAVTPKPVLVSGEGYIRDGVYHLADPVPRRRDGESVARAGSPDRRAVAA